MCRYGHDLVFVACDFFVALSVYTCLFQDLQLGFGVSSFDCLLGVLLDAKGKAIAMCPSPGSRLLHFSHIVLSRLFVLAFI